MMNERLEQSIAHIKDVLEWNRPQSVGVCPIDTVVHPRRDLDMVFLSIQGTQDLSSHPWVFTSAQEAFTQGQIVEVLLRVRKQTLLTPRPYSFIPFGIPQECQMAIRHFHPQTYGMVTEENVQVLQSQFQDLGNKKEIRLDRALFRWAFHLDNILNPLTEESLPPGK